MDFALFGPSSPQVSTEVRHNPHRVLAQDRHAHQYDARVDRGYSILYTRAVSNHISSPTTNTRHSLSNDPWSVEWECWNLWKVSRVPRSDPHMPTEVVEVLATLRARKDASTVNRHVNRPIRAPPCNHPVRSSNRQQPSGSPVHPSTGACAPRAVTVSVTLRHGSHVHRITTSASKATPHTAAKLYDDLPSVTWSEVLLM